MYKILHIPSSTFLKISKVNYLELTKILKHYKIEEINFNNFSTKIWSEEELTHGNTKKLSSYTNFIELKVDNLIVCENLLAAFISGSANSIHLTRETLSLYNNRLFYTFIEENEGINNEI